MVSKNIIQRHLPLNTKYFLIDKKYIPLEEGGGGFCDNCGKLICNVATVRSEGKQVYNIGFDCLETILINNSLLSSNDIEAYEKIKKSIPKILRFAKTIKEHQKLNERLVLKQLLFEQKENYWEVLTFYWKYEDCRKSNDYFKLKDIDVNFLIDTLKNIFPKIEILLLTYEQIKAL